MSTLNLDSTQEQVSAPEQARTKAMVMFAKFMAVVLPVLSGISIIAGFVNFENGWVVLGCLASAISLAAFATIVYNVAVIADNIFKLAQKTPS